mmetsp:Transcript_51302/g.116916  ORF Transcript_51302/g.116916 Transcript_51302/m.116916 type:complete len:377 (+) Transcript_51302:70-1200(+)
MRDLTGPPATTRPCRAPPANYARAPGLDEVRDVHRHLLDLGMVVPLNLLHLPVFRVGHEVDGHSLSPESTTASDTVQVVLQVGGQVVVDHQGHLLHINPTSQQIGGDQNPGGTRSELPHDQISLLLIQVRVHSGNGEIPLAHLVRQVVDLSPGVAVDNGLGDGQGLVEIAQGVNFPVLLLNGHVELPDTLQGQLVLLDQDADGVTHELGGQVQNLRGHGGRAQAHLHVGRQALENVIDLVFEPPAQHLIGLIQHKGQHRVQDQVPLGDHIVHAPGGPHYQVLAVPELVDVLADGGASNAGVAPELQVITQSQAHFLDLLSQLTSGGQDQPLALVSRIVNPLQGPHREKRRLASPGLGLADDVPPGQHGLDRPRLDG